MARPKLSEKENARIVSLCTRIIKLTNNKKDLMKATRRTYEYLRKKGG